MGESSRSRASKKRPRQAKDKTPPPSPPLSPGPSEWDEIDEVNDEQTNPEALAAPWERAEGVKAGVPAVSEIPWTDPELTLASHATPAPDDGERTPAADPRPPGYAEPQQDTEAEGVGRRSQLARLGGLLVALPRGWFRLRWVGYLLLFLVLFPLVLLAQFLATPYLLGERAPYHIKKAWVYQAHGPGMLMERGGGFAPTRASVLAPEHADSELLFHVLAAPFTYGWESPEPRSASIHHTHGPLVWLEQGDEPLAEGTTLSIRAAAGSSLELGTFTVRAPLPERRAKDFRATAAEIASLSLSPRELEQGKVYTGQVRRAPEGGESAPLRSGLVLVRGTTDRAADAAETSAQDDPGATVLGRLLALESGYLRFDNNNGAVAAAERETLLSVAQAGHPLGRLTLGHSTAAPNGDQAAAREIESATDEPASTAGALPFLVHHLHAGASPPAERPGELRAFEHRSHLEGTRHDHQQWQRFTAATLPAADPAHPGAFGFLHQPLPALTGPYSLETRGKAAAAFFLTLLLVTFVYVLRENGVRLSLLFVALLGLGGPFFAERLFALDVYLLGMTFCLLGFHFALHGHRLWLLGLGLLAALAVSASWLAALLTVVLLVWLVQWLTREHLWHELLLPSWAALALGLGLGLFLLHPHASQMPTVVVAELTPWLAQTGLTALLAPLAEGLGLGSLDSAERLAGLVGGHAPVTTRQVLGELWPLWLPLLMAIFGYLARGIRPSAASLLAFSATLLAAVAFLLHLGALVLLVPFAALFLAFAALDHWRALGWDVNRRGVPSVPAPTPDDLRSPAVRFISHRPGRALALLLPLLLLCAALPVYGSSQAARTLHTQATPAPALEAALWMRANVPPEAHVFTTGASREFPPLFFAQPQGRYLTSHHPSFLYFYAPEGRKPGEIYEMWRALCDGEAFIDDVSAGRTLAWSDALRHTFQSEFVLAATDTGLYERLQAAPNVAEQVYHDGGYAVFKLRAAQVSDRPLGALDPAD